MKTRLARCYAAAVFLLASSASAREPEAEAHKITTLPQALERVSLRNPLFQGDRHRIRAAEASRDQAAMLPNPELEIEVEEFGGDLDGFRESESSIAIMQTLEIGGKRKARTNLAEENKSLVELEARIRRIDTTSNVEIAYAQVLRSQMRKDIAKKQVELSTGMLKNVDKRLQAGAILPVEKTKASISLQYDELALARAESELALARHALALLWNGSAEEVGTVATPADLELDQHLLTAKPDSENPYLMHALARKRISDATLTLENSLAVPDIAVGLGYKRLEASDENTFMGLLSVELPVFDRNQGSIRSSREKTQHAQLNKQSIEATIISTLKQNQIKLKRLLKEFEILQSSILPSATTAFSQATASYSRGRTGYLELLDAKRSLVSTELQKVDLLYELARTKSLIRKMLSVNN